MKRIDILVGEDLKKLSKLKGKETIFVKIGKDLPLKIDAISLKNFEGGIFIDYEEPKKYKKFIVYTDEPKTTIAFFKNARANQIVIQKSTCISYKWIEKQKSYEVRSEKELIKLLNTEERCTLYLKNNLFLEHSLRIPPNIKVQGNGYTIFTTKEMLEENITNTKVIKVDQIVSISDSKDLKKLENLTTGVVVATISQDIKKFSMNSISLENFIGTLLLLGNGYSLKEGVIWNHKNTSNGLFTNINLYATIFIKDFHIKRVIFRGNSLFAGGFIGSRSKRKKYHSGNGEIYLINSTIRFCNFYEALNVGNFFGYLEEAVHVINCFASNVKQKENIVAQNKTIGFSMSEEIINYESISDLKLMLDLTKNKHL